MQVKNTGRSSVATAKNKTKMNSIVIETLKKDKPAVVSSAIRGDTDGLRKMAK